MEILSCSHCRTPLRLRERPTQALKIQCPECKQPLEIFEDNGGLCARSLEGYESKIRRPGSRGPNVAAATALITKPQSLSSLKPVLLPRLSDPLVVTWIAAGVAATALGIAFLRASDTPAGSGSSVESALPTTTDSVNDSNLTNDVLTPSASSTPAASIADVPAVPLPSVPVIPPAPDPAPVVARKPPTISVVDPRDLIREHLVQRLIRFDQPTAVPFDTIRIQLEELAGVPIRYDDNIVDGSSTRQRPVQLVLDNATIETVLKATARQADLDVVVDADGVRLVTAPAVENDRAQVATES